VDLVVQLAALAAVDSGEPVVSEGVALADLPVEASVAQQPIFPARSGDQVLLVKM